MAWVELLDRPYHVSGRDDSGPGLCVAVVAVVDNLYVVLAEAFLAARDAIPLDDHQDSVARIGKR